MAQGHFHETVPVLDDKGHLTSQEVERDLSVDIALRWDTGYDTTLRSFVNVIATPKGGTHVAGFERAIVKVINDQLRVAKVLRASEDNVTKDDVMEGLTAVVAVRLAEPQFEGQTKEILGTPAASRIVAKVVTKELTRGSVTASGREGRGQGGARQDGKRDAGPGAGTRPPRHPASQDRARVVGSSREARGLPQR